MRRAHWIGLLTVAAGASLAFATGAFSNREAPRAVPLAGIHKIKHVVVIMQENRSFDS